MPFIIANLRDFFLSKLNPNMFEIFPARKSKYCKYIDMDFYMYYLVLKTELFRKSEINGLDFWRWRYLWVSSLHLLVVFSK